MHPLAYKSSDKMSGKLPQPHQRRGFTYGSVCHLCAPFAPGRLASALPLAVVQIARWLISDTVDLLRLSIPCGLSDLEPLKGKRKEGVLNLSTGSFNHR